jgi:Concanavalin A-like lectin/glucanases superfamily
VALPGIQFGEGINIEQGIKAGTFPAVPTLALSLDAATYSGSGAWIDSVGSKSFTLYGSPTWSNSIGGGSFLFVPGSAQYAQSSSSLSTLSNWSVEVWHYYTGTNTGSYPCIVTELWPNTPSQLNYNLGSLFTASPNLQAGFFNGGWQTTPAGYTLTANNWYQIVGTYDGMNLKLYVNGSMVTVSPQTGACATGNSAIRLMRRWDGAEYWGGRLASVKIWDGDINFEGVRGSWLKNKSRYGL